MNAKAKPIPPISLRGRTFLKPPDVRLRLTSAPSSADPPKKTRETVISIRRRSASGSVLNRKNTLRSGQLCKTSHLNVTCTAPVKLEAVFGRTSVGPNSLAVHGPTGSIAYIAGATVVLTSIDGTKTSEGHLVGAARHPFTCLAFSSCGRYLATGESGHQPQVRLWEIRDDVGNFTGQSVRNFSLHTVSIVAVRFVPNSNMLVSVGCQHDATICVWDWRSGSKLGIGKVTSVVNAIAISPDNTICVTVGSRHVKYWHFPDGGFEGSGLQSRSAILADRRSSVFVDVVFLNNNIVLAITEDGALVEFLNKKYVRTYHYDDKNIPLCLAMTKDEIVLGCTNGVIRLYDKNNLIIRGRLPYPAFIGMDPACVNSAEVLKYQPQRARYPDARALRCISSENDSFVIAYSDRSMFVFERGNLANPWRKLSSSVAHVGAVTVVKRYPSHYSYLPSGSFITAGSDGTVRIWNMNRKCDRVCSVPSTNLLSSTLKKLIDVEADISALVESRGDIGIRPSERVETHTGIRCLAISPDGRHIVAGTKSGKLHIIDLSRPEMDQLEIITAHENDVQCVEYTSNFRGMPYLFASGGRDRLVHIFRPGDTSYEHCYVIDDHQSALNAIRFLQKNNKDFYLFTCGSDKTIIIWRLVIFNHDTVKFNRENQISAQMGINDFLIPVHSADVLLASCQDRQLRSYSLSGKLLTTVRGTGGEADLQQGSLEKFCLDPSETFAASVCSDRHVYVVEVRSGKCVAAITGMGESATDVEFSEDCRRLYVTVSNGCIFVWRFSDTLIKQMQSAKAALQTVEIRAESPDSFLESESEVISEDLPIDNSDTSSPRFGSCESLNNWKINETVTLHNGDESINERNDSLVARPAQVIRRSASNLFDSSELTSEEIGKIDETKSDFVSRQRNIQAYSSSKSMMNLQIASSSAAEVQKVECDPVHRSSRKIRSRWGDPPPKWKMNELEQWDVPKVLYDSTTSTADHKIEGSPKIPQADISVKPCSPQTKQSISPSSTRQPPSSTFRPSQVATSLPSSNTELPQMGAISRNKQQNPYRDSSDRTYLSNQYMKQDVHMDNVAHTGCSPSGTTPKLITSNTQGVTPSGAVASAISRRHENHSEPTSHLRSRSQSPNVLLQQNLLRSSPTSASRDIVKDHRRRRDSDISYTAASARLTPASSRLNLHNTVDGGDIRRSTETLNRIAALRSKLQQSSENVQKSFENLYFTPVTGGEKESSRTRSFSNLKGGNSLEAYGTFDADKHQSTSSFMNSRLLARSLGNISVSCGDGEENPASRLRDTITMLKKASNSDLTQCSLYEDPLSPCWEKMRRRGAVQKRVERYHPRCRTGRNKANEESDSNSSDTSQLNPNNNRRFVPAENNKETSVQFGSDSTSCQQLPDQQRGALTTPFLPGSPRKTNYLAQKMASENMVSPNLGTDDSPRSSVNPPHEWNALFENETACQQLVRHVQDCFEQLQVNVDKVVQAKMLVEESSMTPEQKQLMLSYIEKMTQRILEKLFPAYRSPNYAEVSKPNDDTAMKNQHA